MPELHIAQLDQPFGWNRSRHGRARVKRILTTLRRPRVTCQKRPDTLPGDQTICQLNEATNNLTDGLSSVIFFYIYGDYIELYEPGKLQEMIAGRMPFAAMESRKKSSI